MHVCKREGRDSTVVFTIDHRRRLHGLLLRCVLLVNVCVFRMWMSVYGVERMGSGLKAVCVWAVWRLMDGVVRELCEPSTPPAPSAPSAPLCLQKCVFYRQRGERIASGHVNR